MKKATDVFLYIKEKWGTLPHFFILCYFIIGLINNLYLGCNPKQIFLPILLLLIVFYLLLSSDEKFLEKLKQNDLIIMVDLFLFVNIVVFTTGKFNVESDFFKIIKEKLGIDIKIILLVFASLLLFAKVYFRKNMMDMSILLTLIFFFGFIFFIPILYPDPFIDLYIIMKQSILDISQNKDPYETIFCDIYKGTYDYAYKKQDIKLVYWPMNLYLLYPFQMLFGDLRYAYIFSLLMSCSILYFGIKRDKMIFYISFVLLFSNPYTFYMVKYAWIDILAFPFFALYFLLFHKKKYFQSFLVLGVLISLKLYFIVLLPLSFIYHYNNEKNIKKSILLVASSLIMLIICFLPYVFTNKEAIVYTLEYFTKSSPRIDSLSIPGYVYQFGFNIDKICSVISVILILWILFRAYKRKETSVLSQIRHLCIILFILFLLAKQAFGNYYYNLMFLGIIYICFVIHHKKQNFDVKRYKL